jgi:hypothetical protein
VTANEQTFYYNAYLFPSDLIVPGFAIYVRKDNLNGEKVPAGKVRIRPTLPSVLANSPDEIPAAIPGQIWYNSEDLQAAAIDRDFTDGEIDIGDGELVYGVTYLINIYAVDGYQPFSATIVAGKDGTRTYALTAVTTDPLTLVMDTVVGCAGPAATTDTSAAVITFQFNLPIELAATTAPGGFAEQVDNAFSIYWPDTNAPVSPNNLKANVSPVVQERGTSIAINGNTLTFSWNPSVGLALPTDPLDRFSPGGYVHWQVGMVQIQPVGKALQKQLLQTLDPLAVSIITCQ